MDCVQLNFYDEKLDISIKEYICKIVKLIYIKIIYIYKDNLYILTSITHGQNMTSQCVEASFT